MPGWVYMWLVALGLYAAAKWLLVAQTWFTYSPENRRRLLFYALFWPGMDAHAFCDGAIVSFPKIREWLFALGKILLGAVLLWIGVPFVGQHPLIRGWLGMLALVLMLHFGVFQLVSLFWRSRGVDAKPLMRSPLSATSLSRFWAVRWNTGFADLMRLCVFKPLHRRLGGHGALCAVFLVSGLVHELVITVPAQGGYGLPTLYFLTQAAGVLVERSRVGRGLGLSVGWKGWCFVFFVAGLPAVCLFPPVFIRNVVLPMLRAISVS